MSDGPFIFLLLAGFYLTECLIWVPSGSWVFVGDWAGRWTFRPATSGVGNDRGRLVFAGIFPWAAGCCVAEEWRFMAGRTFVSTFRIPAPGLGSRIPVPPVTLRREDLGRVTLQDRSILQPGGIPVAVYANAVSAAKWTEILRRLSSPGEWPGSVVQAFEAADDSKVLEERMAVFSAARNWLNLLGLNLFLLLFLAAPLCYHWGGGIRLYLVFALILIHGGIGASLFARAHRRLYPSSRRDRWLQALQIALVPTHAMRASDYLGKDSAGSAHPLAVAGCLLDKPRHRRLASVFASDLSAPLPFPDISADVKTAAEEFHRDVELPLLQQRMEAAGLDWAALTAMPEPGMTGKAVCPRCRAEYEARILACEDCRGIATRVIPALKPDSDVPRGK
ncbi:MAG: hypothetical protein KA004_12575 [Verrucomicrobiales bacterium]|nr:hypothetical protein [Verrucomicrobiales bacterium]